MIRPNRFNKPIKHAPPPRKLSDETIKHVIQCIGEYRRIEDQETRTVLDDLTMNDVNLHLFSEFVRTR